MGVKIVVDRSARILDPVMSWAVARFRMTIQCE